MIWYGSWSGGANKSALSIVGDIVMSSGYRGLYRGWLSSIMRDCPFSAIYWLSFESLRPYYASAAFWGRYDAASISDEAKDSEARTTTSSSNSRGFDIDIGRTEGGRTRSDGGMRRPAVSVYTPPSIGSTFLAGASGGLLAALITHPFDVMKTQQQLEAYHLTTTTNHTTTTIRRLGVRGLFSGLTMRLFTVIPASAIMVTIYETIKNMDL